MTTVLLILALAVPASAEPASGGTSAVPILAVPTGARAAVLGAGHAAVADDLYSLQGNPAGLSLMDRQEASLMYMKGVEDTALQFVGYGQPLPVSGALNFGHSAAAVGLLYSQNGSIEVNRTNPDGSFLDSRNMSAGSDLVLSAGYAERIAEDRLSYGATWEAFGGVSLNYLRTTLAQKYSANGEFANAGIMIRVSKPQLNLGFSVANLGPPVRYVSVDDPLPLTYRFALGWTWVTLFDHSFLFTGGGTYDAAAADMKPNVAVEWSMHREFAIRAGYQLRHDDELGISAGFGVTESSFALDYAWVPFSALTDQHRLTLTYRFGEPGKKVVVPRRIIKDIDRQAQPREAKPKPERKRKSDPGILIPGWE